MVVFPLLVPVHIPSAQAHHAAPIAAPNCTSVSAEGESRKLSTKAMAHGRVRMNDKQGARNGGDMRTHEEDKRGPREAESVDGNAALVV